MPFGVPVPCVAPNHVGWGRKVVFSTIGGMNMTRNFTDLLTQRWSDGAHVCVGLDSEYGKIPAAFRDGNVAQAIYTFNARIIQQTAHVACAFKPNVAFYEAEGADGATALGDTIRYLQRSYPHIPIIFDAKRGDIGNTNDGYVKAAFKELNADAITLNPYMGMVSLEPFLKLENKGLFLLCRTSNEGSDEFQCVMVQNPEDQSMLPMYQYVARRVAGHWNNRGNCGLVVGATFPGELEAVRKIVGDMSILIPGVGAQGGKVEDVVPVGKNSCGNGMIINSSRGIIFAKDPRHEAEALNSSITSLL